MSLHVFDSETTQRLEACVNTRSGLIPVWKFAVQLSNSNSNLMNLVQYLVHEPLFKDNKSRVENTPACSDELHNSAVEEVCDFFKQHNNSYALCYYIAISVCEGCSNGEIRRFADVLWEQYQQTLGTLSTSEVHESALLSISDILSLSHAQLREVEDVELLSTWSRGVYFINPLTAKECIQIIVEEYPLLSNCLLDTCISVLKEQAMAPCANLLIQWSEWDYPSVQKKLIETLQLNHGSKNELDLSQRRLLSVYLEVLDYAAQFEQWSELLNEKANSLWSNASIASFDSLSVSRILSGSSKLQRVDSSLFTQYYIQIRDSALKWFQKQQLSIDQWAFLIYTIHQVDINEFFWCEFLKLLASDINSNLKEIRTAGYACITLVLYCDCLLIEKNTPVMGILEYCSSKHAYTHETTAMLRHYCHQNNRFLCLTSILDEQMALLDSDDQSVKRVWPFFKWMSFTGNADDFNRWYTYLHNKVDRNRFPSRTAAQLVHQLNKALA